MTIKVFIQKVTLCIKFYIGKVFNYVIPATKQEKKKISEIEYKFPTVLSTTDTLKRIIDYKLSICRFGDAEFDVADALSLNDYYQKPSKELSKRLVEILKYTSDNKILICIPPFNSPTNNIKYYYKRLTFWQGYWLKRFDKLSPLFINKEYGNSFVSRDSVFYENNVEYIKKIWENRKVVFVYGKGGRFDTKSILFDNIIAFKTILIPPSNAYKDYNRILTECLSYSKDNLFIIAAGPTATVLAFDLAEKGYQALDMGHLPNCYEQYLGIKPAPEDTPLIKNISNEN